MKLFLISVFGFLGSSFGQYEAPDVKVEVFMPEGLRVSIPDHKGIKLFIFHGRINKEVNSTKEETFSKFIMKAKHKRWTFDDPYAKLKVGDILYYKTKTHYFDGTNTIVYTKGDQQFIVQELLEKPIPSVCEKSATVFQKRSVCSGEQIFNENFQMLRKFFWSPETKFAQEPDYEFVFYSNHSRILRVKEGHLEIEPFPTEELYGDDFVHKKLDLGPKCTGAQGTPECAQEAFAYLILPPVMSAQINTKNKFDFKFGKVEIRAKLPKGDWIYPQLFLNPVDEHYGPGYASGQIRIAFLPGNEALSDTLLGGCILGDSVLARNYAMKKNRKDQGSWNDNFHRFTVVWKPDEIIVSVDDQVYGNILAPEGGFINAANELKVKNGANWILGTQFAPFDRKMYLTIGVGVGGFIFEDSENITKPWRNFQPKSKLNFYKALSQWRPTWTNDNVLDVDYVKVWAL